LDAVGIPVPEQMQGRSVLPLLGGRPADWPDDLYIEISESQVGRAIRTQRWKYSVTAPQADAGSADRYVEDCLYDLLADPYELNNLITMQSHRPVADKMRDRLLRRLAANGETPPVIVPAEAKPSGQKRVYPHEINT
jgi:arylsulfatase A-like enzyme